MTRLFANPFIVAVQAALLTDCLIALAASDAAATAPSPFHAEKAKSGAFRRASGSYREVATPCRDLTAALPTSSSSAWQRLSLIATVHRTDEASRPELANRLPGHPASIVRSICAAGSPKPCSRARCRRPISRVDSVGKT